MWPNKWKENVSYVDWSFAYREIRQKWIKNQEAYHLRLGLISSKNSKQNGNSKAVHLSSGHSKMNAALFLNIAWEFGLIRIRRLIPITLVLIYNWVNQIYCTKWSTLQLWLYCIKSYESAAIMGYRSGVNVRFVFHLVGIKWRRAWNTDRLVRITWRWIVGKAGKSVSKHKC
jgi:hypothetical protein